MNPFGTEKVLIVVPAYNEAATLPSLIDQIRREGPAWTLVVIDDGSQDDTRTVLASLPVRVVSLPFNLGIGVAVQTGLQIAAAEGFDVAVQVDGDGQHPPNQIVRLLSALQDPAVDVVVGSRFLQKNGFKSTLLRRIGIRCLQYSLRVLCGLRVTDPTSGFRALNRSAINLLSRQYAQDYPEVEALVRAHRSGMRIEEVPVVMAKRQGGRSSIGLLEALGYMVKVPLAVIMILLRGG